jgi:outer membrane murein-binding lipoprotein Lpp
MSDAAVALIAALAGGSVLKMVEYVLNRGRVRTEQDNALREELRKDIESLRAELQATKAEAEQARDAVDEWRDKFYALRDDFSEFKAKINNG